MMLHQQIAKISLNFPAPLLEKVDEEATELKTTRSDVIRRALESYLKSVSEARLRKELKEGYVANAKLAKKVCEEWKFTDAENL
ncbi:MAG TPA: ribbon-helix-helix domain-containing protein [Candidatus Hypogeohydataceae bacterium YC38]|nr:ribbon-helix-helix protein, CopG family [Candidatus Brocadiales bacterium]